jgi:hypothetical protein
VSWKIFEEDCPELAKQGFVHLNCKIAYLATIFEFLGMGTTGLVDSLDERRSQAHMIAFTLEIV